MNSWQCGASSTTLSIKSGAFDLVHLEVTALRQTINELLQPEEADPETEAIRKSLDAKFLQALDNPSAIDGRRTGSLIQRIS